MKTWTAATTPMWKVQLPQLEHNDIKITCRGDVTHVNYPHIEAIFPLAREQHHRYNGSIRRTTKDFIMIHCMLTIMIWIACGCIATSQVGAYVNEAFAEADDWDNEEEEPNEEEEGEREGDET